MALEFTDDEFPRVARRAVDSNCLPSHRLHPPATDRYRMVIPIGIVVKQASLLCFVTRPCILRQVHSLPRGVALKVFPTDELDTAARVLATASRLFYAHGVRAVGVEWIVAESGVAKTSMYRHFHTKDDLIAAFLEREDREFWTQWDEVVNTVAGDPMRELMALLDWIGQRVSRDGYRGCPQINAAAEFSDPDHPARKFRARHKAAMFERLRTLVSRIGPSHVDDVAHQIALLIDGAFSSDGRLSRVGATRLLQSAVRALIREDRIRSAKPRAHSKSPAQRR
ncbi:MAG: TetR/AcrR family transcriptional regulator [Steroidobacteraceae bacterium]